MEYISREAAIDAAIDGADKWDGGLSVFRNEHISEAILALPAADVREVVRCADCVHYLGRQCINEALPIVGSIGGVVHFYPNEDDYCSYGEIGGQDNE